MDISKYVDYFHDGNLDNISHLGNNISFTLESSVIEEFDKIKDKNLLSRNHTFKGKLCLCGIKRLVVENKENKEIPWKEYDDGEILDLEIDNNKVFLLIEWKNWPPKLRARDVSKIEIEADKIYWENIPDLPDNCCQE